jgi:peptidoglycan/xylan/chitin deacetylase (PgdA/CDA1 family)
MGWTTDRAREALRLRSQATVVAVLSVAALVLGLLQAPPAAATNSCPAPIRAVLDSTPATSASTVALTFDDGPSPQWTPQVLDVLRARGVKATFFVLGRNVAAHPQIARRIVAEGHVIANHSYSHPNFDLLSPAAQAAEIDRTNQAILDATGVRACFFRGPGGSHHGASVKDLAWARGMNVAGWARDTLDWTTPLALSPAFQDSIVLRATSPLTPHPTILMHDGSPGNYRQNTVDAVDRIITFYAARGYVFTDPAGRTIGTSAIQQRFDELGGPAGSLGAPVTDELPTPDGIGAFTHYQRGSIYWSPATGAHEVRGAIRDTWAALGWEQGPLGFPTSDEYTSEGVQRSDFQRGSITWTPQTGAVVGVTG